MKKISEKTFTSQTISPPIILTLNQDEVQALETYEAQLSMFGYEIEPFGGKRICKLLQFRQILQIST